VVVVKYPVKCVLCEQPVEIEGFSTDTPQGRLAFCCAGCQSIYQLIYMNKPKAETEHKTINKKEDN